MNEHIILNQLEELAEKLGIRIRYDKVRKDEPLNGGGLCWLKGEYIVIINMEATVKKKIQILSGAVRHFDLENVYMKPALRRFLDGFQR